MAFSGPILFRCPIELHRSYTWRVFDLSERVLIVIVQGASPSKQRFFCHGAASMSKETNIMPAVDSESRSLNPELLLHVVPQKHEQFYSPVVQKLGNDGLLSFSLHRSSGLIVQASSSWNYKQLVLKTRIASWSKLLRTPELLCDHGITSRVFRPMHRAEGTRKTKRGIFLQISSFPRTR